MTSREWPIHAKDVNKRVQSWPPAAFGVGCLNFGFGGQTVVYGEGPSCALKGVGSRGLPRDPLRTGHRRGYKRRGRAGLHGAQSQVGRA